MAEYWDSEGNITRDNEFQGPSSTALKTGTQLLGTIGGLYTIAGNPQVGSLILLGKTISTMGNRLSRPGIDLINQYGSDNLIDSIYNNNRVFGEWMDQGTKESLLKDALALSQDVYVINGNSDTFYHTCSYYNKENSCWYLVNSNLQVDQFPPSIKSFCNKIKSIAFNFNNYKSGLGSMLCFSKYKDGKYIVGYIFEGTNTNGSQDAGADLEQGVMGNTPQYTQALHNAKLIVSIFNNTIRNIANLYFFGHSLGGGLANAAALSTGFPAITFNAASLHPDFVSKYKINYQKRNLAGIYVDGEVLSTKLSGAVGLPKTGDRYRIKYAGTKNDYYTDALANEGAFKIAIVRKHMLEPLCALYKLKNEQWDKKNEL